MCFSHVLKIFSRFTLVLIISTMSLVKYLAYYTRNDIFVVVSRKVINEYIEFYEKKNIEPRSISLIIVTFFLHLYH